MRAKKQRHSFLKKRAVSLFRFCQSSSSASCGCLHHSTMCWLTCRCHATRQQAAEYTHGPPRLTKSSSPATCTTPHHSRHSQPSIVSELVVQCNFSRCTLCGTGGKEEHATKHDGLTKKVMTDYAAVAAAKTVLG